jgi:hypothetical protein
MTTKLVKTVIIIAIILSVLGFLSYSYNADVEAISNIKVTLDDIDLTGIKVTSFKLKLDVNISNPTNQHISNLSSNFDIYIAENYVGKGNFSKVSIPASSYCSKDIFVTIYYSGLADAAVDVIKNIITNEEFDLTIDGKISGNALFGLTTVSQNFKATQTYP